ncbi:type IV pilus biogenesis/stability protein PilW [Candidatus Contendibacter odensensis]|uniref:Tfp pilus assembly protein PilF n=1 Tax=Candidatus Contendobacter odensis Run_B_J11 TaxID=1400861 RepID=A0A7U7J506_9GAMM|nr:type IV pilus biogenesis/stability protein PilW [Candidatus Contendobacter odensis]MBK8751885.1 type IV pilus biogenesis/stability protein PilW [Candidatus Competibacteraceae bacterium]CDH46775.1 putative Tfp pilus assembly protein PilF [Candidatus Contendobacter odensis Run_B_J11]
MRLSAQLTTLSLTLLLGACAGSQEREFKENVAEANFKLGIGYMQSGHYEVAAEKLLKSLQFDESSPETHNAIAVLYEEMREYSPAEIHFKRAIELKPDYTLAKLNYARFLCTREPIRTAEGEAELQKMVADPANAGANAADAYAGLATCARKRNDPAQAEIWLRKALELNPNNTSALLDLAELSQNQNQTLQARAFLQRYHAQTRPTPQSLWLGIAIEQASDGDPQLRREYGVLLLSQFPNSDEARRLKQSP